MDRGNGKKEEEAVMSRNDCFLPDILIHPSGQHKGWDGASRGKKRQSGDWWRGRRIKDDCSVDSGDKNKVVKGAKRNTERRRKERN